MSKRKAVLDTCVLYPNYLRDFLLRLAILVEDRWSYEPIWSNEILRELANALVKKPLTSKNIDRLISQMNLFFPDALVDYTDSLNFVKSLEFPDAKDLHVVATGIASKSSFIVTHNLSDFPANALSDFSLFAASPQDFVLDYLGPERDLVLDILHGMAQDYRRPTMSIEEIVHALKVSHLDLNKYL